MNKREGFAVGISTRPDGTPMSQLGAALFQGMTQAMRDTYIGSRAEEIDGDREAGAFAPEHMQVRRTDGARAERTCTNCGAMYCTHSLRGERCPDGSGLTFSTRQGPPKDAPSHCERGVHRGPVKQRGWYSYCDHCQERVQQ